MSIPKVSVLMPCYNASEFIHESVESILNQVYSDFELILINDGSTDDTLAIGKQYAERDKRIKIISKSNTGLPDSLNVGLNAAQGEWIARLDADDIAMPYRLQKQMKCIDKSKEIVLVGSGCVAIDRQGNEIGRYKYPGSHFKIVKSMEKMASPFPHSSAFFSRNLVKKIGGYCSRFKAGEDIDLWFRISNLGSICCLPEPLIKLRKHAESITVKKWKYYLVMCVAAIICNFRTKLGVSRPAEMDEKNWSAFLKWVESELDRRQLFDNIEEWDKIRAVWYDSDTSLIVKGCGLLWGVLKHPGLSVKKITQKIIGTDFPQRLALKSLAKWPV
jgi:glycosyltransferase involved in cell wall biosynthesis